MKDNELDDIIQNYNESIKVLQAICDDINGKEIKQITEEDINI